MSETETAPTPQKSIINPKYREKYRAGKDWLAELLTTLTATTKVTEKKTKDEDGNVTVEEVTKTGNIDVDALFALAAANNIDVSKYEAQRESHGFPGRFRMTVRNMLQASIKRRHGLFTAADAWLDAPTDWLASKGAPSDPTETPEGTKIAKVKAAPVEAAVAE